jgi:type IV secretory pathway VirB10-like protein
MSNFDNDPLYANEKEAQARRDLDRRLQQRDDENTSRGLLIGVLATVAIALGALAWFLLSAKEDPAVVPVPVPETTASPTVVPSPPDVNINITEPSVEPAPEVEITVPPSQSAPPAAPEPQQPSSTSEATPTPSPEVSSEPSVDPGANEDPQVPSQ